MIRIYLPTGVKSLRDAQESWNEERLKAIFKTKSAFNKERRKTKTVYNSRSTYMKTHGLHDVGVQDDWEKVKDASGGLNWLADAQRLSAAGSSLVAFLRFPAKKLANR